MAKLLLRSGSDQAVEIELQPGACRIGRGPANDLQIADPSVSTSHCEILVDADRLKVRDLGSTNGTFIDGAPVSQADLQPGQTLRLGSVELFYANSIPAAQPTVVAAESVSPPSEEAAPPRAIVCANHPTAPARVTCRQCGLLFCDACVNLRRLGTQTLKFCPHCGSQCEPIGARRVQAAQAAAPRSFFALVPGAFKYPFARDGAILLVGGALFLAFMNFLMQWAFLIGLLLAVITYGYLTAYMQKIVASSAHGETHLPRWPDFGNFLDDLVVPFLQMLATVLVCFLPAALVEVAEGPAALRIFLEVLGNVYFPLAWLAVSLTESFAGLNPLVILPTIVRLPAQVLTLAVLSWLVFLALVGSEAIMNLLLSVAAVPLPGVTAVVIQFVALYLLVVEMRILGLFYFVNGERLRWF